MEKEFSSDEETEQLPGESDHSDSEPPSSENEDEEEMSEQEENGEEVEPDPKDEVPEQGKEEEDAGGDAGGEAGTEGDAEGEGGDKELREEGSEKPKKKTYKRKKSKVKGDSAQPKAKKKRKGKEPASKKKRRPSKPKHLRRDIKTLMKETELDDQTLAAQREEEERKKRLEEQRAQNVSPPALLTQLLETKTSDLVEEQRLRNIADTNDYILLESSSGEEDKKQTAAESTKAKPELIEILSSDEDVKVLSESEKDEQSDAEFAATGHEEESGTHTDDTKNQLDELGRVLVNVAHPQDEQDIFLPQHLAMRVKAHQIGGIRFLYDNLVESINRFSSSAGFGCILAHSMGLGKTLQVICFTDIFLRYTTAHSVLIIVPINTLQNWIAEFDMWLPEEEDTATGREGRQFNLYVLNDTHKTTVARGKVIRDWHNEGGVMLMGYEIYRLLCNRRFTGKPKRRKKKASAGPEVIDLEEEERMEKELHDIRYAICNPGPDLVVCDEGHRIKNSLAGISKALKNIKTRRRVVLTGYPLQNNLMEYWCMVDFVRPNYLGTKHEFSNLFERPIQNGQCVDSTATDMKLMRYRAHVLHNKLEGFVQRRGFQVLKVSLPEKHEHVILVRLTQFQKGLYCKFMQCFKDAGAGGWCSTNPLKAFAVGCKIWNHPDILFDVLQKNETDVDTDLDIPDITSKTGPKKQTNAPLGSVTSGSGSMVAEAFHRSNGFSSFEEKLENMSYQEKVNQILSFEWARENMRNYTQSKLSNGGKMVLLFHIIDESIKVGDKILVFSQSLMTLSLIEKFLSLRSIPDPPNKPEDMCKDWIRNVTYFRLDGSTAGTERERMINQFNEPSNHAAWLFLLSTRAGCLGVNLIGANRVVVLDASWNPCHDAQAVCRVYRYGQKKTCHIYRMVTDNTLEKKIYDRQISKKGMSDRVVDELNPQMNLTKREVESLLEFDDSDMPFEDFGHLADTFQDTVLQSICRDHSQVICKAPFSTESLLWDRKDQRLTRAEKAQAKKSYEDELRLNTNSYSRPSYTAYYPKSEKFSGSPTSVSAGGFDTSLPYLLNMRGQIQMPKKPVASVRPLQSTPVPKYPPGPGLGLGLPKPPGEGTLENLKGLTVQRIKATTDILLPGVNTLTNSTTKINAGEVVTFIKTQRGIYLRTPEGRFIAVRGPSNKNPSQLPMQSSGLLDSKNVDRDSPGSSMDTKDLPIFSMPQLSTSTSSSNLVNSIRGPISFIPQLTGKSMENGSESVTTETVVPSNAVNPSAISTSMSLLNSGQSGLPLMFPQSFMPPLSTQSGRYQSLQPSSMNFSPSRTPPLSSSMASISSGDLSSFFSHQGVGTTSADIFPQGMSYSQSNIMSPSVSSDSVGDVKQDSISPTIVDSLNDPLQRTSAAHLSDALMPGGNLLSQGNMIPSAYPIDTSSGSMPLPISRSSDPSVTSSSSPSLPPNGELASSSGGFQGGSNSLSFLSVSPQLPALDGNSVEQILMNSSSENDINSSSVATGKVQSSNLASLSEFVSSTFQ